MVLGFDNGGLLFAMAFAAVVLKPHQLIQLGRQTGRYVGWAVGHLSLFQKEISNAGSKSEIARIQREVQDTVAAMDAIRYEIRRGSRIFPMRSVAQPNVDPENSTVEQIPISAEAVREGSETPKKTQYGSEILLQSIYEQEIARRAQTFMETGKPPS